MTLKPFDLLILHFHVRVKQDFKFQTSLLFNLCFNLRMLVNVRNPLQKLIVLINHELNREPQEI